jgi:hypothetical protein
MQSTSIRRLTLLFILFSGCPIFAQTTNQEIGSSVKFEVSSIRVMTDEERARKAGDNLDPDLVMKCRIENRGKVTVYLYTDFVNSIVPRGHLIRRTDKALVWILDSSGKESSTSPGFSPLKSGGWLLLGEGDAVEWEELEKSPPNEETHAMTVFMKYGGNDKVVEVFSNFYKVPAKNTK